MLAKPSRYTAQDNMMIKLKFRPSTSEDLPWLDSIHTCCMREHVEKHYEWNPNLFSQNFQLDDYTIVQLNDNDIGFFKVIDEPKGLYLADMMIAPDHQGHGIGGNVIDHIVSRGRPVRLQVLKYNPARYLYERKGFKITEETEHHFKMERAV